MLRGRVPALWLALHSAWLSAGAQPPGSGPSPPGLPAAACTAPGSPALTLLACFPGLVTEPLDLSGLYFARRPLVSALGLSWTGTRFRAEEVDLTDLHQPGLPQALFSAAASEFRAIHGLDRAPLAAPTAEVRLLRPEAGPAWRARLNFAGTAAFLAASNLPPQERRGLLQQPERFQWFTGNDFEVSGPVSPRVLLSGAASGYWGSQTIAQAPAGRDLDSNRRSAIARLSAELTARDRLVVSGLAARYRLSDYGLPPGLQELLARRMSPDYSLPTYGFAGLGQTDRFDAVRAAWLRNSAVGPPEASCAESRAWTRSKAAGAPGALPQLELTGGGLGDVPPLAGNASRSRTECVASFEVRSAAPSRSSHRLKLGGRWMRGVARNQPQPPGGRHLLFADSAPAFVVEFGAPAPSPQRLSEFSVWVQESLRLTQRLGLEFVLGAGLQRASLSGIPRSRIAWNQLSPRLAATFAPLARLTIRTGYALLPATPAGRYLDYADPGGLSGIQSFWRDTNGDRRWQPAETGSAVFRFGGRYSSLDPDLRAPLIREANIAVRAHLPVGLQGSVDLFRQDLTRRIAAVNAGLAPDAFVPVAVADPGPDGRQGTHDDQLLKLYAQDPATFATDRYLLTNAHGLDMAAQGILAQLQQNRQAWSWWVSFLAVKALGPADPGNSAFENDPGMVGSLLMDPNHSVNSAGRTFFDRAYVGKAAVAIELPARHSGLQIASNAVYLDGLAFGRRLLVTGLPQGPFLAAATVRGSPEGGHRTQYVLHWNLRLSRTITRGRYRLRPSADLLNVLNRGHRLREMDLTSTRFLERLPVSIQPPRSVRLNMEITF